MAANRSQNGTATNDASSQTNTQRNAFSGGFGNKLGASRTNMGLLFDFDPATGRGLGENIDARAADVLAINYGVIPAQGSPINFTHAVRTGSNPDFPAGHTQLNYKYVAGRGESKYADVSNMKDKPNIFGPNLLPPDVNNPTADTEAENQVSSPTANYSNSRFEQTNVEANGYGTETDTNDPRNSTFRVNKPFFLEAPRTDTTRRVLGEFFNTDSYDYED